MGHERASTQSHVDVRGSYRLKISQRSYSSVANEHALLKRGCNGVQNLDRYVLEQKYSGLAQVKV